MTTMRTLAGSLLIVCFLASDCVAAVMVAAAGVIDARSLVVAIEQDKSINSRRMMLRFIQI
jgi:hypothetical protein